MPPNQNRHRDKYFRKKQRGSIDYLGQRNGHRICVLGNEQNSFLNYNTGQDNLAKTANCVFLSRKYLELPPSPNFNVVLEVFVCECAMTSTLILGEGGGGEQG